MHSIPRCHGAPGLVGLLATAAKVLPHKREPLLAAALNAGELVWERGLILKGLGLCHGIAGNAYSFLTLWHLTQDEKWLSAAHGFAEMMGNPELLDMIRKHPDRCVTL